MASLTDPKPVAAVMVAAGKMRQRRSSSSVNNATATLRVSISDVVNIHVSLKKRMLYGNWWRTSLFPKDGAPVPPSSFLIRRDIYALYLYMSYIVYAELAVK